MFEGKYSKKVLDHNDPFYYPENRTILPFFGYDARLETNFYTDSYGGNYYVTEQGANTYKVTKSATHYYNRQEHYAEYKRGLDNYAHYEPRLDELEEEFYQQYIVKDGVDIWYSPYIAPTLEDFHKRFAKPKNAGLLAALGAVCIILAVASVIVIGIVLMDVIESMLPSFLPITSTHVASVPFVILMVIGVLSLVKRHKDIKELRATPYEEMPREYKDALLKRYFKVMKSAYRGRLGEILQEYYLLRESAKQKENDARQRWYENADKPKKKKKK